MLIIGSTFMAFWLFLVGGLMGKDFAFDSETCPYSAFAQAPTVTVSMRSVALSSIESKGFIELRHSPSH